MCLNLIKWGVDNPKNKCFCQDKWWGLLWWSSSQESALQCREHRFSLWSGKTPHASGRLSPCAPSNEPVLWMRRAATPEPCAAIAEAREPVPWLPWCYYIWTKWQSRSMNLSRKEFLIFLVCLSLPAVVWTVAWTLAWGPQGLKDANRTTLGKV